MKDAQSKAKE